jgi:hypothetical protein
MFKKIRGIMIGLFCVFPLYTATLLAKYDIRNPWWPPPPWDYASVNALIETTTYQMEESV